MLRTLRHATSGDPKFLYDLQAEVQILGANMSALGLSQKPIYSQGELDLISYVYLFCPDKD